MRVEARSMRCIWSRVRVGVGVGVRVGVGVGVRVGADLVDGAQLGGEPTVHAEHAPVDDGRQWAPG